MSTDGAKVRKGRVSRSAGAGSAQQTFEDQIFLTSVPYLIYRSSSALTEHMRSTLRKSGLTVAQWRVLSSLSAKRTATVNELVECTAMKQPTISKAVAEMEAAKLITREYTNRDQRVVNLSLSAEGVLLLDKIRPLAAKHIELAQNGFEARDIEILRSLLSKLLDNLA